MDIRDRALARLDAGGTVRDVAKALSVALLIGVKWSQRLWATKSAGDEECGQQRVRAKAGATPGRIGAMLTQVQWRPLGLVARPDRVGPFHVARSCGRTGRTWAAGDDRPMWNFTHAGGLSFKKTALASEQDRPDMARKRLRWKAHQGGVDMQRLVFIDEVWAKPT